MVAASGRLRHTLLGGDLKVVLYQIRSSHQRFPVTCEHLFPLKRKMLGNVEKETKRKCTKFECSQDFNSCRNHV